MASDLVDMMAETQAPGPHRAARVAIRDIEGRGSTAYFDFVRMWLRR